MKLEVKHLEALKSIGFDLATDERVLTEYFNQQKNANTFFNEKEGVVSCTKTKAEIVQMILALATRNGIDTASYEVCELLEKAAAERKQAIRTKELETVDEDIAKAKAELARLEALKAKRA